MNTQLRNTFIQLSYNMKFQVSETKRNTYQPYNGIQSLQQLENCLNSQMKQRTIVFKTNKSPERQIIKNNNKEILNTIYNQIQVLKGNLQLAISKLDRFIHLSQIQLFNITTAQTKELPTHGVHLDKWIYLEKFYKDFQILIADLKIKKQFLQILMSRVNNKQQIKSIQNWLQTVNTKYITQLDKQLNFSQWKLHFTHTNQQFFKILVELAKQDIEIIKKAQKQRQMSLVGSNKTSKAEQTISKSQVNISGLINNNCNLRSPSSPNNKQSFYGHVFNKKYQEISNSGNNPSDIKCLKQTSSIKSDPQRSNISSLTNSKNEQFIIQYSEVQSFKTSSLKRWFQQKGMNRSLQQSIIDQQFQPINVIPFTLTSSYHPQSDSSNSMNTRFIKQ